MKKMTVTELNALADYVVESVLNAKRESAKKAKSTISERELNELFEKAKQLHAAREAAKMALKQAADEIEEFERGLSGKNFEGRFVFIDTYTFSISKPEIREMGDHYLFDGSELEPGRLLNEVKRKLILKNLGSEVDVEKFVQELVESY